MQRLNDRLSAVFFRKRRLGEPSTTRLLCWGLGVPLGLYALYVAAATAFVCLGGMTAVTRSEKDVRIDVAGGYSIFPGRFRLKGVRIQFKDYNVEMAIFAEEAQLSIALHRLLQKRIHVHWVRASGVEYRMLHRVKDPKKSAARMAAFPDIPAFDRPAYYDAPRPPRSTKKPWSLRVDSIDAEAHSAWVLEYQVRGTMRAKGAFYTDPLHEAAALPCEVILTGATISVGEEQIAHDVRGTLAFELAPFTVRDAPFEEVLPKMSSKVGDFTALIDTLSFTKLYFSTEPILLEGRGQLEIDTAVTRGKIEPGSIASLSLSPLVTSAQGHGKYKGVESARGNAQLSFKAAPDGQLVVAASAHVPPVKDGPFSLQELSLRAALWHSDLTEVELRGAQVDLKSLQYGTPEFLYALFGWHPAIPMSGKFHLQAQASFPEEEGTAELEAKLEALSTSFYFEGERFGATATTTMSCRGSLQEANCGVDFHAPYLLLNRHSDGDSEAIWLRLKTQDPLEVSANRGTLKGPIVVSGGDPKDALSEWMGKAWLPQMGLKFVPTGPITGSFIVARSPGQFSLLNVDIATGKTRIEGEVISGETTRAVGTLAMPVGRFGFESTPAGVQIRPFIGQKWLGKQDDQRN